MSYFSNGVIKAAKHRVKNTNSSKRYSWPFFVDPTWDIPLAKIPIFDPISSYENISPEKEKFQIQFFFMNRIYLKLWKACRV